MKKKSGFAQYAAKTIPLPPSIKKTKEWKIGAKFKRPFTHELGGAILTVLKIEKSPVGYTKVYAVEDNLWTNQKDLTLVG